MTNERTGTVGRGAVLVAVAAFAASAGMVGCGGATDAGLPASAGDVETGQGSAEAPPAAPVAPSTATTGPAPAPSGPAAASAAPPAATASAPPAPPPPASKCPAGMAEVPGGKFKSSYYRLEMSVEPFCIDRNLITADEYKACVDSGKCDKSAVHACDPSTWEIADRGKMPMICVDFMQAERYCKAQGKRLVSDLEWEWVARGGDEARTHPWGNDAPADQLCWAGKEKRTTPCPVASYPPGPYGIHDLVGNVYQWTTTTNDSVSSFRGGRGGSWKDASPELVTTKHRSGFKNTYRCGFLGIRCATAVP